MKLYSAKDISTKKDRELIKIALEHGKKLGAEYVEARIVKQKKENIHLKNGNLNGYQNNKAIGIGIRVLVDGYWGFAGNPDMKDDKVITAVKRAYEIAKASGSIKGTPKVELSHLEPVIDHWCSEFEVNPFDITLDEKLELLYAATNEMNDVTDIFLKEGFITFWQDEKIFASSDGTFITQMIVQSGAGISASARDESGEIQIRSFPSSFRGDFHSAGFEFVKKMPLKENAYRIAKEASDLLKAPECPVETMDIILGESQLALQVHESCGHPVELDRVFGMEANYAGTSFMMPELLGNLQYGSDIVNIVADGTVIGALGTFGYDDEGVKACKSDIIKDGIFVGYLTSRETAPKLNQVSNATTRATDWNNFPIIRMTNINLLPGKTPLEEIIRTTKKGMLLKNNKSWSIDDKRINFQFGCEIGWMIENGKITGIVKNPTYSGTTKEFWNSCDAIANGKHYRMWGTPNCGKGQPGQIMKVGHGVSLARFKNVKVGVGHVK